MDNDAKDTVVGSVDGTVGDGGGIKAAGESIKKAAQHTHRDGCIECGQIYLAGHAYAAERAT
jgi:hypothetical protein